MCKKLSDDEKSLALQKLELQELIDSVDENDIHSKMQVLENVDNNDLYSNEMLEFAAYNGATWADDILTKRIQNEQLSEISDNNVVDIMLENGYKLPTSL